DRLPGERALRGDDLLDVAEEPGIDRREIEDLVHPETAADGLAHVPEPVGVGHAEALAQLGVARLFARLEAEAPDLERAHRLLERLLERPADRHRLADRLHLRAEGVARLRELLEGEARDLGDDVVDRRLEAGWRLARDVVRDLVERVADGEVGRDLGDREAGRRRGEGRAPRVE